MKRNRYLLLTASLISVYSVIQSCQGEEAIRTAQYAVNGQKLYVTHCQNCHGAKGEGLGTLYPPLTDTTFLHDHRQQLACIVKNGLSGPIEVHGQTYETDMPGNPRLSPIEVAYVLTYIGNSFGNDIGIFTQEEVQAALTGCEPADH